MRCIPEKARAVVLGGAGGMGRVAVATAARLERVGEIVVADLDGGAARSVVAELETTAVPARLRAASVDVTDHAALGALLVEADVVLNTTGPFYRMGVPTLQASLDAGCHYLDICDDWEPTLDMLELHGVAAARGLVGLVGMGASPGASNLLAVLAAEHLDEVEDLFTAWPVDVPLDDGAQVEVDLGDHEHASAAVVHWMHQISGTIEVVEHGVRVRRAPLQPVVVDYPGRGSGTAYTVGHPEPMTLPPGLRVSGCSANLMVLSPATLAFLEGLRHDIDAGRISVEDAARAVARPGAARSVRAAARAVRVAGPGRLPAFFALASGRRDGTRVTVGARARALPPSMALATGIPLALGLGQLLDGTITTPGVHPPESVVDARAFFDDLAPHCLPPRSGIDSIVELSEHAVHDS